MNNAKKCIICEEDVFSDSLVQSSCELCGMLIPEPKIMAIDTANRTKSFCCESCLDKYSNIHPNKIFLANQEVLK